MKGANNTYFGNILEGISSLAKGLAITFRHLKDSRQSRKVNTIENQNYFDETVGITTIEYPHEAIPVPDNGRYRLTNEIDDCIVCDLCAKICPVNCIEIEAIKSTEEIGKTSDGSTKRIYAGVFNIDMAKCCYCGLCTTVCPTECLTMTKTYDYSEFDVRNMVYHFSDMSPADIDEKKKAYEEKQKLKAKPAATTKVETIEPKEASAEGASTVKKSFKPVIKPAAPKKVDEETNSKEDKAEIEKTSAAPTRNVEKEEKESTPSSEEKKPVPFKPRPVMKPKPAANPDEEVAKALESEKKEQTKESEEQKEIKNSESEPEVKKPVPFKPRPIMKPKPKNPEGENPENKE